MRTPAQIEEEIRQLEDEVNRLELLRGYAEDELQVLRAEKMELSEQITNPNPE